MSVFFIASQENILFLNLKFIDHFGFTKLLLLFTLQLFFIQNNCPEMIVWNKIFLYAYTNVYV